jgi:hypothetical protein
MGGSNAIPKCNTGDCGQRKEISRQCIVKPHMGETDDDSQALLSGSRPSGAAV